MNLNEELVDSGLGYLSIGFCDKSEFSTQSWALKHGCTTDSKVTSSQVSTQSNCFVPGDCQVMTGRLIVSGLVIR